MKVFLKNKVSIIGYVTLPFFFLTTKLANRTSENNCFDIYKFINVAPSNNHFHLSALDQTKHHIFPNDQCVTTTMRIY